VATYTDNRERVAEADLAGGPGLRLLEEDIQHVRLNVVWIGTDGRCAELRSDVK
jgi:hypothetical protein